MAYLGVSIIQFAEYVPPVRRVEFQASRFLESRGVGIVELCGSHLNPSLFLMAIPGKDEDILS